MRVVWTIICLINHVVLEADAVKVFYCEFKFTKYDARPAKATGTFSRADYATLLVEAFQPSVGAQLSRDVMVKNLELSEGTPSRVKFKITSKSVSEKVKIITKLQSREFDNMFIKNVNSLWNSQSVPYGNPLGVQLISPQEKVLDIFGYEVRRDYLMYAGIGVVVLLIVGVIYRSTIAEDNVDQSPVSRVISWDSNTSFPASRSSKSPSGKSARRSSQRSRKSRQSKKSHKSRKSRSSRRE